MKKSLIILFCALSTICQTFAGESFLDQIEAIRNINYRSGSQEERLYKYKNNFLKIHNFTFNFGAKLLYKLNKGEQLNGHELNLIHESLSTYTYLAELSNDMLKDMAPKRKSKFLVAKNKEQTLKDLEWLSFKSILLQNFKNTYLVFYKNTTLRRIIKNQIRRENYSLETFNTSTDAILNRKYRRNLELALKIMMEKLSDLESYAEYERHLKSIKDTVVYEIMKKEKSLKDFASQEGLRANAVDNLRDGLTGLTNGLSFAFGSVAGNISWRQGYLKDNPEAFDHIKKNLKPLDLLFEKRGYVFTDLTIPGNWGHVAVWLGTKEELKEMGLWDHPAVMPHQNKIQKGYNIFQVRRWGLEFDTLENFMNLDEVAIIRHENILERKQHEIARVYNNLFDQIGKKYDFGFDAMTANEITCTEIITLSYGDISWPSAFTLGRYTIVPDNMAEIALYKDSPFKYVSYLRGKTEEKELYLTEEQYAQVLGYRISYKNDSPIFEKKEHLCKNRMVDNGEGELVSRRVCKDEYLQPIYKGSTL